MISADELCATLRTAVVRFFFEFFSNFKLREKISHFDYRNVALDVGKGGGGRVVLFCKPVCFV